MYVHVKKYIASITLLVLLNACASITAPTGGPIDAKAPSLKSSFPKNNGVNFKGKNIELVFDEPIELNNLNTQLLITPYMENKYTSKIGKNKLILTFEKDLPTNTTFTFKFREGVKDIHEATNIVKDLHLAFSTGEVIDSLQVSGKVSNFLTTQMQNAALVGLYQLSDTLNIRKQKPYYFGKTDINGSYQLSNIQASTYFAAAFDDKNNNLLYDEKEEVFDFYVENLKIDSNQTANFQLFRNDNTAPRYIRTRNIGKSVVLAFSEGLADVKQAASNNKNISLDISADGTDIRLYPQNVDKLLTDSMQVGFTIKDSSDNQLVIQKKIKFDLSTTVDKVGVIDIQPATTSAISTDAIIKVGYASPIDSLITKQIRFNIDSTQWKIGKSTLNKYRNILEIRNLPAFKKQLGVIIPSVAMDKGITSKADTLYYKLADESNFGIISGSVTSLNKDFIVELLDEQYKVLRTVANQSRFKFTLLPAGKYRLRLIHDKNSNGRWDTGNLERKIKPEPVLIHKELINLKANWELDEFKL